MAPAVFPDNTVLINFACIDRLDLLRGWLRDRGHWTRAVADEARHSAGHVPAMRSVHEEGWLGSPIEIDGDSAVAQVDRLRRNVFGGTSANPRQHLGEAQTCYLLGTSEWSGSWWISDDQDAVEYARGKGFVTLETIDIFRHVVADRDLTAQEAFDVMMRMGDEGRGGRLPNTASDLAT